MQEQKYILLLRTPVKYPNVYGIDMATASELIASKKTVDQIKKRLVQIGSLSGP